MMNRILRTKGALISISLLFIPFITFAGNIKGSIKDKTSHEVLIGATVQISSTTGTVTDFDGNFELTNISDGTYNVEIKYVSYKTILLNNIQVKGNTPTILNIEMEPESQTLGDVTVVAQMKKNTDVALLTSTKNSLLVQSGVSAQQISKTQDKDASEVIRRVPGVSIIDEKFVMVRGLSQRYNNVWVNGSAVPSSEADSRAFSFDIIPSSQLDNMIIVKSPAPEYPADFTGGFILINTKDMPSENGLNISVGGAINDKTHFRDFIRTKSSSTDWIGFDNGFRSLNAGMKGALNLYPGATNQIDLLNNGLNNDWRIRTIKPVGDLKVNMTYNHKWETESGRTYGMLAAVNYSNTFKTYLDMENSLYGPYNTVKDEPVYLRKATDDQYSNDVRIGAMLNLTFKPRSTRHHYEFKNIFNQIAKNRYSERWGFNAQPDNINNMEYYYSSRTTYNGQFTGKHTFDNDRFDWSAGYAYANRNLPDRRRIERTDRTNETMSIYRIIREFTRLDEHIASANVNYRHDFAFGDFTPVLKAGLYGEYRTRAYNARQFQYAWMPQNTLPAGFQFNTNVQDNVLIDENYGMDKLYMYEEVNKLNDYKGNNTQGSGYVGMNLPFGVFNLYAGVRYEYSRMELIMNTRQYEESPNSTFYDYSDFFPSVNMTYKLAESQQLRLAYGKSVNRPEFRELSTSVFNDFDLGSDVMGNSSLKAAYIHNLDLRYEWYPSNGEQISVALFYKRFNNPIEWTYTMAGGTDPIYSYVNAKGADNYGVELDIRKNLDFIGLKDFSLSLNAALIKSKVEFEKGSKDIDRPMQGQSPYLINAGIFYRNERYALNAAVLYNRIGKRIIGVGRSMGSTTEGDVRNIPNSYEMPRNSIDLSLGKTFGRWELKASVRDLLAERVYFKQFEDVKINGQKRTIEETTKSYKPGRTYNLSLSYSF
ncbi:MULTISPECIES: TonB-dependent receptor [unclassified Bacteroides]|jgi:TonB-dependent receptor|uniref:TonB-dependent receptor n=1 Tax=unclassified Bacteroides TaxID=2646097 RepID=UPI001F43FB59|nr:MULTISPECIES: TonB-dependent receptor [unclassified Bacteroides]